VNKKGYDVKSPPEVIDEFPPPNSETIQKVNTTMLNLRERFKLIPVSRDSRNILGQRVPFIDSPIIQNITTTSNSRDRNEEIKWERYRNQVESLISKRLEPNPSEILVKEGGLGLGIGQYGGGDQCLIGLIWETQNTDAIYAVEEPENHLHPRKQKELYNYFNELAKTTQIFICTHSPIFASRYDISGVYLVSRDENGDTQMEAIDESNVDRIIDELGIRASYQFDTDNVTFVEGQNDIEIFSALRDRIIKNVDALGFIDAEGWNNMNYYANARVLNSRRVNVGISVIFDGDTEKEEKNKKIKDRMIKLLNLSEDNIYTLKKNKVEDYLLKARAIKRAFPTISYSTTEISNVIKRNINKKDKKTVLDQILKRGGIGKYNGLLGAQIIQSMTEKEIDDELRQILNSIVDIGKPPKTTQTEERDMLPARIETKKNEWTKQEIFSFLKERNPRQVLFFNILSDVEEIERPEVRERMASQLNLSSLSGQSLSGYLAGIGIRTNFLEKERLYNIYSRKEGSRTRAYYSLKSKYKPIIKEWLDLHSSSASNSLNTSA